MDILFYFLKCQLKIKNNTCFSLASILKFVNEFRRYKIKKKNFACNKICRTRNICMWIRNPCLWCCERILSSLHSVNITWSSNTTRLPYFYTVSILKDTSPSDKPPIFLKKSYTATMFKLTKDKVSCRRNSKLFMIILSFVKKL